MNTNSFDLQEIKSGSVFLCFDIFKSSIVAADIIIKYYYTTVVYVKLGLK